MVVRGNTLKFSRHVNTGNFPEPISSQSRALLGRRRVFVRVVLAHTEGSPSFPAPHTGLVERVLDLDS